MRKSIIPPSSDNGDGVARMVAKLIAANCYRVLVVGGSPTTRSELRDLVGRSLDLRFVDGTAHRNKRRSKLDVAWADIVVVWGNTQLGHKVSELTRVCDAVQGVKSSFLGAESPPSQRKSSTTPTRRRGDSEVQTGAAELHLARRFSFLPWCTQIRPTGCSCSEVIIPTGWNLAIGSKWPDADGSRALRRAQVVVASELLHGPTRVNPVGDRSCRVPCR